MNDNQAPFFSTKMTKEQSKDSGMALVLILLVIGLITKHQLFVIIASAALLLDMIVPSVYYPFAVIWFGIANLLGTVTSKVLLTVIYFIIVLPVALLRKMLRKDTLLLKAFKKGNVTVMRRRDHEFQGSDLEKPF